MFRIDSLNKSNFNDFVNLLRLRGEAPEDYYYWKYMEQHSYGRPTGFVAYSDSVPVGCIGVVNRTYIDSNDNEVRATWFADWFVIGEDRSKGTGKALLRSVKDISSVGFGIPGPEKARKLAQSIEYGLNNDFEDYCFLIKPFAFAKKEYRSEKFLKSYLRGMIYTARYSNWNKREEGIYEDLTPDQFGKRICADYRRSSNSFLMEKEFVDWFVKMPELPNCRKKYWHCYSKEGCSFFGFSEPDTRGLVRATLLYYDQNPIREPELFSILNALRSQGVHYLIVFASLLESKTIKPYFKKQITLATLNSHPLNVFSLDRENVWYSQQKFYPL
jgi:hypothetical protein